MPGVINRAGKGRGGRGHKAMRAGGSSAYFVQNPSWFPCTTSASWKSRARPLDPRTAPGISAPAAGGQSW